MRGNKAALKCERLGIKVVAFDCNTLPRKPGAEFEATMDKTVATTAIGKFSHEPNWTATVSARKRFGFALQRIRPSSNACFDPLPILQERGLLLEWRLPRKRDRVRVMGM
jgi:hypothetical protein